MPLDFLEEILDKVPGTIDVAVVRALNRSGGT